MARKAKIEATPVVEAVAPVVEAVAPVVRRSLGARGVRGLLRSRDLRAR